MASQDLIEIMRRAESLSPDEQLELIAHLAETSRLAGQQPKARRDWREIRGSAPYPLTGEDAQAWVSRTRRESDEARERALKRLP
jgi:hypothetical protein